MQKWLHMVLRQVSVRWLVAAAGIALVACDGGDVVEPTTGDLEVTTVTSGPEPDPDGYTIAIDDGPALALGANATFHGEDLAAGEHSVGLAGVAANCALEGENPRLIEVVAGQTASLTLAISCSTAAGGILVTVTTTGSPVDPDGYVATLDGADPGLPVGTDDAVSFTGLTPGAHEVALTGLSANCRVDGEVSRTVEVVAGATSELSVAVVCTDAAGTLEVAVVTTGPAVDADGYLLTVDGGAPQPVGSNATLPLGELPIGDHVLTLAGIAGNCHLDGENPRTVTVAPGSATVTFTLQCLGSNTLIAFTSNAFQLLAVLVIRPDGSGLRNLTPAGQQESDPVWSPDGRQILFLREGDLLAMDADGNGRVELADGVQISEHRWSPDGRMIAYVDVREEGDDAFDDLWVMQADGSGKVKVAEDAFNFAWSPDGRLVYTSVADFADVHLRLVNADGSGDTRVTERAAFQPAWAPDGSQIAFVGLDDNDIYLVDPDGANELNLTQGVSDDESPIWSPDGSRIAFTMGPVGQPLETEIAVMNRDGTGRTALTSHPGFDFQPTWAPDGTKLVFTRAEESGDTEVYVMNADGSGQTNLTNRPDSRETTPDWNGRTGETTVAGRLAAFHDRWLRARR